MQLGLVLLACFVGFNNRVGLWKATLVGLSAVIGSTIFIITGIPISLAGGSAVYAFLIMGLIVFIVALQFAELSSAMPREQGGAYSYATAAFGSEMGFITGVLLYFAFCTMISAIALGFGSYLSVLMGIKSAYVPIGFALALIAAVTILNIRGMKEATNTTVMLMLFLLLVLTIFVYFTFSTKGISLQSMTSSPSQKGIGAFFAASISLIFAYYGFQSIVALGPDTRDARRTIPYAILLSVLVGIVIYVLVVLALITLVPASHFELNSSPFLFALGAAKAPVWIVVVIAIGAFIALVSAAVTQMMTSSKLLYQMSVDGLVPRTFRRYNRFSDVAVSTVVLSGGISMAMLFFGNIYTIVSISNFGLLFSWLISSFAIISFRRRKKGHADFKVPLYPYLSVISVIVSLIFLIQLPRISIAIGIVIIIALMILYYFIVELKHRTVSVVRLFD